MSYQVEIVENPSNILEIESSVNGSEVQIQILQNTESNLSVSHTIALLPSDFNDNVRATINNFLNAGYGISIIPSGSFLYISTTGLQPSGDYSLAGHSHVSTDISDFISAVSAAAPVKSVAGRTGNIILNKNDVGLNNVDNTSDINKPVSISQAAANSAIQSAAAIDATTKANNAQQHAIQRSNHVGTQPISTIDGLQTAIDLKSNLNHTHTSSNITDFASAVSGLLPVKNIVNGSGIFVSNSGSVFTVAVTGQFGLTSEQVDDRVNGLLSAGYGINLSYDDNNNILTISTIGLQPSGDYSIIGHTHLSSSITDFTSAASGASPVQSVAGRLGHVVLTKNDIGLNNVDNTSDINKPVSSATQNVLNLKSDIGHLHTSSNITDFSSSVSELLPVKNILSGSGISVTNSGSDFTVAVTGQFGLTGEQVDDRVSNLLVAGNYVNLNYNDYNDSLAISVTGLQPSGNYSIVGHSHNINDVSGLQNLLDSKQPSGDYANYLHSHTSNDITDFNSAVSGLLPVKDIISGNYTSITSTSGNFTISVTGLQPSGDYANSVHTHTSSQITDFSSSVSGLLIPYATINSPSFSGTPTAPTATSGTNNTQIANTQFVRTEISNLVNSAPSTLDTLNELAIALGNDANFSTTITNSLANKANLSGASFSGTISAPSGDFNVLRQSGVNVSISGHSHSYSDITNFASGIDANVTTLLNEGSYIDLSYDTINDVLTISATGLQPSGNYSVVGHTHLSTDINDSTSFGRNILTAPSYAAQNKLGWQIVNSSTTSITAEAGGQYLFPFSQAAFTGITTVLDPLSASIGDFYIIYKQKGAGRFGGVTVGGENYPFASGIYLIRTYCATLPVNSWITSTLDNYHTHTSSNITDFNTSVSGLLPVKNVSGTGYVNISSVSGDYTISVNGLQPSGSYSLTGHTHTSSDITDFNSSVSGLLPVKDIVSGTGISVSSSSGIYTINSTVNEVAQAASLVTTVFNKTGSPIPKMSVVYINGGQGDLPTISLAAASGEMTSSKTYGITYENISNMSSGKVIVAGALTGLNTDQFNPTAPIGDVNGSILWLSPTIPGSMTTTKPSAPYHMVAVGTVVRTHQNEGVIEVRIQNGFELEELHNVAISGVTDGQFLQYNSGSDLWIPSSSGNFSILQVNGTGVSLSGHTHTAIIQHGLASDLNALVSTGINYTYIFNNGSEGYSLVLPTAVNNQSVYTLKNNTDGIIYIKTSNSETVDNYNPTPSPSGTVIGLNIKYSSIMLISDNSGWLIV